MKRSKNELEGGRPRRPRRQRTIGLELLERRELLATLDATFGNGGRTLASIVTPGATNATYGAITTQADGKYIVVGTATNLAGNRDFAIARLNANGTVDTTFNANPGTGGGVPGVKLVGLDLGGGGAGSNDDFAQAVGVQADGKIVVAGIASGSFISLVRLLPNGAFDLSFEGDGILNTNGIRTTNVDNPNLSRGVSLAIQPSNLPAGNQFFAGNIVVAAGNFVMQFDDFDGRQVSFSRITFTGNTFDPGTPFGPGVSTDTLITDLAIDPLTGKIVVVGEGTVDRAAGDTFEPPGGGFTGMGIARLLPNGNNDFSFGEFLSYRAYNPSPTLPNPTATPPTPDSNLNDNPTYIPQYTFSLINTSDVTTSVASAVAIGPNNTIYIVGTESLGNRTAGNEGRLLLVRLRSQFIRRGDYDPDPIVNGIPSNLRRYGNHPTYKKGDFSYFNEEGTFFFNPTPGSIKLEGDGRADGLLDSSFAGDFGVFPIENIAKGVDVAYDAVSNTVVAIGFRNLANPALQEFAIVRTDANGILDTNFTNSFGQDVNQRFQTVTVNQNPADDLPQELVSLPDGRIVIAGSSSNGTTTDIGLVRLLTEEPPTFSISDAIMTEGDSGTLNADFTVSLSRAYRVVISVDIATAGGTAVDGTDFFALATPTTVTFAPGVTSVTVSVPVIGDFLDEPDETFTATLSNPVLGRIVDGQGAGTIVDNDPEQPTITINDVIVTEGNSGTANAVFTVFLSRRYQLPISVDVSTANGTGIAGTDYVALPNPTTVTFAPGVTAVTVSVPVISNMREQSDRTFFVNLANPVLGLLGADSQGMGTIDDDDPTPPTISIGDATVTEGDFGTVNAVFTVSLSSAYVFPISVDVFTANGTALAGTDYFALATPTTLTFAPGVTSLTVSVPVNSDLPDEPDETFTVNLANPVLGTILDGQGVGFINDDDPTPPTISIGDVTVTEGDFGPAVAVFTVSLSGVYFRPISVDVFSTSGTATDGPDFAGLAITTLTFAPGVTSLSVSVPVRPDTVVEPAETFTVNLTNPVLGVFGDSQAVGTIIDSPSDVNPPVVLNVTALRTGGRRRRRITGFEVQFSEALDPSRAQDFDNYILSELRRGPGRLGRPRRVALREVRYDPSRNVVTLVAAGQPQFRRGALVNVGTGVTDRSGTPLDGNADGVPGPSGLYLS